MRRVRALGRGDDSHARELVGEAQALDLVGHALTRRVAEGIRTGRTTDQSAAITRLYGGTTSVRTSTIVFELTGPAAVAWSDEQDNLGQAGIGYLMRQAACIGGGTTEMSRNVISERVLGMPREKTSDREMPFRDVPPQRAQPLRTPRPMRFGFHLPQFGRAIATGGIEGAAVQAEELGYNDVWVSDHLIVPADQAYPAPYLYDPLMALAFAAAATNRIGIGTSVLVATQYTSPLAVANMLASLDHLSGGRLTVGAGIGWSRAEYEALGASFDHRGQRLEEILALWQTAWHDDPATHVGDYYPFQQMRILPKPAHEIPVWLGGTSDVALQRALRLAQGYHGIGVEPRAAAALVERIRKERPDERFIISLRVAWDARSDDAEVRAAVDEYTEAGVQHLLFTPDRGDLETWLTGMAQLARQLDLPA